MEDDLDILDAATPDWLVDDPFSAIRVEPMWTFPVLSISSDSSSEGDDSGDETYSPAVKEKSVASLYAFGGSTNNSNNSNKPAPIIETTEPTAPTPPREMPPPRGKAPRRAKPPSPIVEPEAPRSKSPSRTKARTKPAPRARAPRRLTEEQKESNKRKREEEKSMLLEMRSFLAESTKKQKTVQAEIATTNSRVSALQSDGGSAGQTDFIAYLTTTVAAQQQLISSMNLEIFNMGARYRSDADETEMRYRDEIDALRDTIESHREHDAAIQLRVNEWRSQRARLLEELEKMRTALTAAKEERRSDTEQGYSPYSSVSPPQQHQPQQQEPVRVKPEPSTQLTDMTESATHYTWLVVEEANNARCLDLYGFTAPQLLGIAAQIAAQTAATVSPFARKSRGPKVTYGDKQTLLMLLYHFRHYTVNRVLHEKFGASKTLINTMLNRMLANAIPGLFAWSQSPVPVTAYAVASYFLPIQTPAHTQVASNMYDEANEAHGVWIHCAHCVTSGKVMAYYSDNQTQADAGWLAQFVPLRDSVASTQAADYERRMRGKFTLAVSRYRGTLQEIDNTIRGLLALTNLDLGYDNAICERISVSL